MSAPVDPLAPCSLITGLRSAWDERELHSGLLQQAVAVALPRLESLDAAAPAATE